MTDPIRLVDAGDGVHLNPADITATYEITELDPPHAWTDIPEARPRCRMRVTDDAARVTVIVTKDGELHYDPKAKVKVDRYPGEKYAAVRAEGDARWGDGPAVKPVRPVEPQQITAVIIPDGEGRG